MLLKNEYFCHATRPLVPPWQAMNDFLETATPKQKMDFFKSAPAYEPDKWQDLQHRTNCLTYAMNLPDWTWLNPGDLAPDKPLDISPYQNTLDFLQRAYQDTDIPAWHAKILGDGCVPLNNPEDLKDGWYPVAVFYGAKGYYYHFVGANNNGYFSQKDASGPVTDQDAAGRPIEKPALMSTLRERHFAGYVQVPSTGLPAYHQAMGRSVKSMETIQQDARKRWAGDDLTL